MLASSAPLAFCNKVAASGWRQHKFRTMRVSEREPCAWEYEYKKETRRAEGSIFCLKWPRRTALALTNLYPCWRLPAIDMLKVQFCMQPDRQTEGDVFAPIRNNCTLGSSSVSRAPANCFVCGAKSALCSINGFVGCYLVIYGAQQKDYMCILPKLKTLVEHVSL